MRCEKQVAKKVWIIFIVSEKRKDIIIDLQSDCTPERGRKKLAESKGLLALLWLIKR